ncbi:MAG: sigma 54-interacting transcriptional regulator [Gammaproteobacteria bacterium]
MQQSGKSLAANADQETLLVVEDDPGLQSQLRWSLDGFNVILADDRESALAEIVRHKPAVVTLDLGLPPDSDGASEGLAALERILETAPETKVIVVSGNDDRENAVRAVGIGAYDFYQKPIDPEILRLIIERAFHVHQLESENRRLQVKQVSSPLEGLIAGSPQMLKVCRTVEKVAPTDVTTLLLGESGTSELFGYEKGAFTGAAKQTRGKIEYADGGTLFLDEVGDLPMTLQVKLLRFLQERIIERLGGRQEIPVDVRVVCATHQDLPALVKEGGFREDLYYRISEITIRIPPLREREGDTLLLARAFLDKFSGEHRRNLRGFTPDAVSAIEAYGWPGNVRELENKLKRAVIMADGNRITAEELELSDSATESPLGLNLREVREAAERAALQRSLSLYHGNVSQAAEALGVSRPTMYDLMNKYGLKSN